MKALIIVLYVTRFQDEYNNKRSAMFPSDLIFQNHPIDQSVQLVVDT